MKANHTDITIVLDRSGSMQSVRDDTIGGFNRFLSDQQVAPGSANITLNQFDHEFETVLNGVEIKSARPLDGQTFVPRGNTALFDAIGRSINETGKRIEAMPESDRPEKVVFVIVTDGEENHSREFNKSKVMEMIQHQREKYQWEFVFLGANQDAIAAAGGIGISASNAMTYAHNSVGTCAAFASTSKNLRQFRAGGQSMGYSVQDREAQANAGASH